MEKDKSKYLPPKPNPEINWDLDDPITKQYVMQQAFNNERLEQQAKEEHARLEAERQQKQALEKQHKENARKLEQKALQNKAAAREREERMFQQFLTGHQFACTNDSVPLIIEGRCPRCGKKENLHPILSRWQRLIADSIKRINE